MGDWSRAIDAYCERLGPGLWAEPLNAATNLAFLIAALWAWPRVRGLPAGEGLAGLLAVIGIGSGLFHTIATAWAGLADVLPIVGFILLYLFLAARDFLRLPQWAAAAVTLAFLPYAWATTPLFARIPGIGSSAAYAPVPALIFGFALLLTRRAPGTALRLAAGAAMLCVSIVFRSLDAPVCARLPLGTHFLWHLCNAILLAWMIEAWRRHVTGPALPAEGSFADRVEDSREEGPR